MNELTIKNENYFLFSSLLAPDGFQGHLGIKGTIIFTSYKYMLKNQYKYMVTNLWYKNPSAGHWIIWTSRDVREL